MKYYIIAGEASGDLHGSNLMREIFAQDHGADIRFWGGDLMAETGGTLVKHYRELAFMGFAEVVLNLRTILRNIKFCKADIEQFAPDVIIFIDYPGFNLRIAAWAKKRNIRTFYYISPQIWAWKENRIKQIRRDVDEMFVILPFEKDFYERKHQFPVRFVGHPLIDAIQRHPAVSPAAFKAEFGFDSRPIVALLPGSRKQEVSKMLQIMLSVLPSFPDLQFAIAGAPGLSEAYYAPFLTDTRVHLVHNRTYDLLSVAAAALVTSGTATLETALFKVPEVVCYKGSWVSYQIAKRILTLKYISLVNLIMDREVVKELIQTELNTKNLTKELNKLFDEPNRTKMLADFEALEQHLGGAGASKKVAEQITALLG